MELQAHIKKIVTKEKEGLVTISTTFEMQATIGHEASNILKELSAYQGVSVSLTIEQ